MLALAFALGCGDDSTTTQTSSETTPTGDPTTNTTPPGTGSESEGTSESTGTETGGTATDGTTGTTGTTGMTTMGPGSSTATTSATTSGTDPSTDSDSETGIDPTGDCDGMGGQIEFSYLWVANSGENTVSKIDTMTLQEVGRYRVQPNGVPGGSPSRTSVNLAGDMAVANRCNQQEPVPEGCAGITKIAARVQDCVDLNDNGMIETSDGPGNVLPYGSDECVLWHTPLTARSNRPVAWTAGTLNEQTCKYENPMLWTATSNDGDPNSVKVYLLDGEDGTIVEEIVINGWSGTGYAVYGGAVDSKDDFWFVGGYSSQLGHVRIDDLTYEVIQAPGAPYGSMVDSKDRPWLLNGGLRRYDPMAQTWQTMQCPFPCTSITQDGDGHVWVGGVANDPVIRLIRVDADTMQITGMITAQDIPELGNSWGLTVDVEGYLWAVEMGTQAFKINREDYTFEVFNNSTSMYTYSDMTGHGLLNVQIPQ